MPILHKLVEIFKRPPKSGTEQKQLGQKSWTIKKKAMAGTVIGEGIQAGDIAKPE
jgi:hypothetical protein